jgi:hypothetical protein
MKLSVSAGLLLSLTGISCFRLHRQPKLKLYVQEKEMVPRTRRNGHQ